MKLCCNLSSLVYYLVLTAALSLGQSGALSSGLERRDIKNAKERRAVCNDFSNAIYFMRQGSSQHWIVYFEGGGGCSNFSECNQRYLDYPELMQSQDSTSSITGDDFLSNDREKNELFHNYTHVLIPYCSSDAWLGNRTIKRFENGMDFYFNDSDVENSDNFVYTGQSILRAVIEDLCELGLTSATDLILAGSSAGGIGLLNNLDWIRNQVPVNNTRVVIDSSWFIGYSGYHVLQFSKQVALTLDFGPPACHDLSLGYPCCVSPACLFSKGYLDSTNVPILAVSSLYDVFTLERPLREVIQLQGRDDQALLALFNGYGSIMNETLIQSYSAYSHLSVYAPSCSQHVYFAPSGELAGTTPDMYQESLFRLTNPVEAGNWERVNVNTGSGTSYTLLEALKRWTRNSTQEHFFITDACNGPTCGTCPSKISVMPEIQLWSATLNYIVLILAGLMTVVAVLIKTSTYFYMKYLLLQQKLFSLNANSSKKRSFPKPTHAVNVACLELSHHIELVRGAVERRDQNDGPQQLNSHTNTKLEVCVPCYKQICSKWCTKFALRQNEGQLHSSVCIHNDLMQPDSGFSSSHNSPKFGQINAEPGDTSSTGTADLDTQSYNALTDEGNVPIRKHRKTILNQVNMYINPGELVAIMGPSGSGKTTLLDVLLNKRTTGTTDGEILINGIPISKMHQWFVGNTGYVRQLATYYYNELTVRENLLFSMNMQAVRGMSLKQKLERVEQVIREMGLQEQADVIVGDSITGGLSGGQRKRLAIAVQLLSVPNILFLDEPTSGLDSASSLEILKSLSMLAETGRAVVVTIHQPRSEIFHSFDKILLLCRGQVAFFGSPIRVWDFFTQALNYEDESLSEAGSSTNTADRILDLLKEQNSQQQVLCKYRGCGEPMKVKCAIRRGKDSKEPMPLPIDRRNPGFWHRLVSLEARASLRQTTFTIIYLPIVYLVFGTILGTTYLYTKTPVQVMSVTCLLSCSSSLFMSSIIMSLLVEPLKLFRLEHSDGISSAHELILQVFIRMSTICTLPLAVCATLVFVLVYQNYAIVVYITVLLVFLLVNQCWLALFILLTVLYPQQAHRLCPVFSAIGGFCCGFIIPKPLMPVYYSWIFYINPSYYAYASTTVTVLHDNDLGCTRESPLECFRESSIATLSSFGLEDVNPIEYMVILIVMVWVFLLLAVAVLQLQVMYPIIKETLQPLLCCLVKGRKRHSQVHSSEALGLVEHNPTCILHASNSALNPQPSKTTCTYDSVIDLEAVDTNSDHGTSSGCVCTMQTGSKSQDLPVSTDLLQDGKHCMEFTFPWARPQPVVEETDFDSAPTLVPLDLTPSQDGQGDNLTEGEVVSPSSPHRVVLRRGESMGIHRNRAKDTVVQITMQNGEEEEEEEGIDECKRLEMANEKWKLRKAMMDTELRRLKHNEEKNKRYSGAFVHQALDTNSRTFQNRRRTQSSSAGINSSKAHGSSVIRVQQSQRKSRSRSMQHGVGSSVWLTFRNPLMPEVTEEEEEETEEEAGLGLPPKDVPFYEDKTCALDMSQIPMEEIAMVEGLPSQTSDHWNTDGEQDSPY